MLFNQQVCIRSLIMCAALTLGLLMPLHDRVGAAEEEEMINPHWTGKHCLECHMEEPADKENLKFDGDSLQLCNRCHETEFARTEIHPVGVQLLPEMKKQFTREWPMERGALGCLTCHDALPPMYEDFALEQTNPKFLRGAPYRKMTDFCFSCHVPENYKKTNPHEEQLTADGRIIERRCLYCHESLPDPSQVRTVEGVSFRGKRQDICLGCHGDKELDHPARADHNVAFPEDMAAQFASQKAQYGVDLPLIENNVFCGTCHNPHQKGVLQRKEVSTGAGEDKFLRLNGWNELCLTCHHDQRIPAGIEKTSPGIAPPMPAGQATVQHDPWALSKCKACHAITADKRSEPQPLFLCFREGCHKSDIVRNTFSHESSVLENCSFCHSPHSSEHEKLLTRTEMSLCSTCHPLVRDAEGKTGEADHDMFTSYMMTLSLSAEKDCALCHSPAHRKQISTIDTGLCSQCHEFVRQKISHNVHQRFEEKRCAQCHNAHAAPYEYLLKEPPETYDR